MGALGLSLACSGSGEAPASSGSGGADASGGASSGGSTHSGGVPGSGGEVAALGSGGSVEGSGGATMVGGVPSVLSETGLFEGDGVTLGPGVRAFVPQFPLWTDTAAKRRWIYLPPGTQIDTSDMDAWVFPAGTKLWKEFERDGVRVETRLLLKAESGSWRMMPYLWRADRSDADAVPDGLSDAASTLHDVPSAVLCADCHARVPDRILGFSAVQLAHSTSESELVTLEDLKNEGLLTVNPEPFTVPGDATAQAALGYLHANCGHCHNPGSSVAGQVPMYLWLNVDELDTVETTQSYITTVGAELTKGTGPAGSTHRILPGDLVASGIYARMASRGEDYSMPPLGTEDNDTAGLGIMEAWIMSLGPNP